jgi:hypothetical protein
MTESKSMVTRNLGQWASYLTSLRGTGGPPNLFSLNVIILATTLLNLE